MKCKECQHENGLYRSEWCEHAQAAYDKAYAEYKKLYAPVLKRIRDSQILTAEDYNLRINTIG